MTHETSAHHPFIERDLAFVDHNPNRVLRSKAAARYIGYSPKHLRALERDGKAPPRVQLGPNSVGYRVRDLDAWLDARTKKPEAAEE